MAERWQSAAGALGRLMQDEEALAAISPEAAWTLLNGMQTGLRGMERAVGEARRHPLPTEAKRALGELTYALNEARDVLERFVLPAAEKTYGFPPGHTRWTMEPADD